MPTTLRGEILIGVSGHFSAAHRDQLTGQIHGHTWQVRAWFKPPCRSDARCLKVALDAVLATLDHRLLPDELAWGEDIARVVATLANVVAVEVDRPAEGICIHWSAECGLWCPGEAA
jgi:6-pyruvoyl-tetrahydropterin synthase